jgi:hypothetical protein
MHVEEAKDNITIMRQAGRRASEQHLKCHVIDDGRGKSNEGTKEEHQPRIGLCGCVTENIIKRGK